MAHERFGVEPPSVAEANIQAAVEHVEALGLSAREAGQVASCLDQFVVGCKRRGSSFTLAVGSVDNRALAAPDLELLNPGFLKQVGEAGLGGLRCRPEMGLAVKRVESAGGDRGPR